MGFGLGLVHRTIPHIARRFPGTRITIIIRDARIAVGLGFLFRFRTYYLMAANHCDSSTSAESDVHHGFISLILIYRQDPTLKCCSAEMDSHVGLGLVLQTPFFDKEYCQLTIDVVHYQFN